MHKKTLAPIGQGFLFFDCASGGNRTRTRIAANRILSPACLPVPPPRLVKKNPVPPYAGRDSRAKDRARTGHPDLGKVVLYQMSYFRVM
jgi:hypothetical protein